MENIDKGFTVPKWVLINQPKIPQMPQNLSAKFVCPSPKVWDSAEKRLHWASIVRESTLPQVAIYNAQWLNWQFFCDLMNPVKITSSEKDSNLKVIKLMNHGQLLKRREDL